MSNLKAKINATSLDLSAFVVSTMVAGLKADNIPVNFNIKDDEKPQILKVEMIILDKDDNT